MEISEGKINMKTHNGVLTDLYFIQIGRHQGKNPQTLKYTSTEQQSCPLSGHATPIAAVRAVFSWAEAFVYLLASCESLGGRDFLEGWPGPVPSKDVHVPIPPRLG